MTNCDTDTIFNQCITNNQQMFNAGRYQSACDYLLAAYNLASAGPDYRQLAQVEQLAAQQCRWLELHSPAAPRFSAQSRQHRLILDEFRSVWQQSAAAGQAALGRRVYS